MEVYVDVDETVCYIPWSAALTPVLSMIPANSIFVSEADTLNAPQEQKCILSDAQDVLPWLVDIPLEENYEL